MTSVSVSPQLLELAIAEAPAVIDALRSLFTKRNPDAPVPTNEEVIAGFHSAFESSLAKDDAWRAAHPEVPADPAPPPPLDSGQ